MVLLSGDLVSMIHCMYMYEMNEFQVLQLMHAGLGVAYVREVFGSGQSGLFLDQSIRVLDSVLPSKSF